MWTKHIINFPWPLLPTIPYQILPLDSECVLLEREKHWLLSATLLQVEKFHKLWNFENCQYAIMELQPQGHYKLITNLKSDP